MLEPWILGKLEPLRPAPLIVLRDPQRMIQAGARAVDGWAEDNGYAVLFCAGNLALREMYEAVRDDQETRVLLVDRSRSDARSPLFYPDLDAATGTRRQMELSLRDFLVEQTGDANWPHLVNDRNLSRLILASLPGTLRAHEQLRQVGGGRFSDSDLYRIVLGAALGINPFKKLGATEIRRLCVEQHDTLEELDRLLPDSVMQTLRQTIKEAPKPFCWLLERDPALVVRAFTLAAIMHQHGLDYQLLLPALDPNLHEFREIERAFLQSAMQDQLAADPERVLADVQDAERFLRDDPDRKRLALLLRDQLQLDVPERAVEVLKRERLSPMIRALALVSLLAGFIEDRKPALHRQVIKLLEQQSHEVNFPALSRPTEEWTVLEGAFRRAHDVFSGLSRLIKRSKELKTATESELNFESFDSLWNIEGLNRQDYYISDLERTLRVGNVLPVPLAACWPELEQRWNRARAELKGAARRAEAEQAIVDSRFQDLYRANYATWILQPDAPVIFTHQFLPRLFRAHWDPRFGRKAVILVFDGLRTDAWDELVRPVLEERFQVVERRPGSALIPTETQLSRKAISAGDLPKNFTSQNELKLLQAWLKQHMRLTPDFQVLVDDDTVASGMTVRYVSDQIEYIVFNFTDKNLHGNPQDLAFIYNVTVREIIRQDVRSVVRELPKDAVVFITSDHGFTVVPEKTVTIPGAVVSDRDDVKYRGARTIDLLKGGLATEVIDFDARQLGIPLTNTKRTGSFRYMLFPRPGRTFQRESGYHNPDRYTHGGISLAECMVPMVVMGPRQAAQPALILESIRQVGAVTEGEQLAIEIRVKPLRMAMSDMTISLSFSRDEITPRREVFPGRPTSYTVRWIPQLDEVTETDRSRGSVVQPVTVVLSYQQGKETMRDSRTVDVEIKLDPSRLRRRIDSKLDFLMGKVPKGLK